MAAKLMVCLVLIAAATAVPLNLRDDLDTESTLSDYQCARQCSSRATFDYKPSQTYVYEYAAMTETSVAGASEDKAKMRIQALANIEVISKCEFALRLQNVKIEHTDGYSGHFGTAEQSQEFQRALTANSLRFSFENGIIRDICHSTQEQIWVLNFKRGLLSAFQNSMSNLLRDEKVKEVDISGECQAQYNTTRGWLWTQSNIEIVKSKNLLTCSNHNGVRTNIPMVPYKIPSEIQSMPVMKSSQECKIAIGNPKILESVSCSETHIFAPFSNHQSGAVTIVTNKLTYKATKTSIDTGEDYIETRSNLMFHHLNGIDEVKNSREAAEQKLKEICEQTKVDVRPETPRLFSELVHIVKDLERADLRSLYKMIKDKNICNQNVNSMKYLLDTLPVAGTTAAVELMVTVINRNDIPDLEKHMWLSSLSLIKEPSGDMLPVLGNLLTGKFSEMSILPVSALLHTICEKSIDCERSYQFKKIMKKMVKNIDSSCKSDEKSQVLKVLRGIGNIGHGQGFLYTLKGCLNSQHADLEVRVAAADAYRRFKCQEDEENGPLFTMFKSETAEAELRIVSFLSLMRCPKDSILQKVAHQLEKENNENVGTFVYTHLQNLKQTSDPHKQDVAEAVKQLDLRSFAYSGIKTSRNFESSVLVNRFNLGYVAESDLIWSKSSVVPRAARVNLTLELFGNSINVFEAGARVDGVERFVQKYFGTEGYFTHDKTSTEELEASIYARMFGNEVFFQHLSESKEFEDLKSIFNLDKFLDNLSNKYDYSYTHSQQLFDVSLIIPTTIGLPLNITVNSSVSVDVEAKGNVDVAGLLSRSKPIIISTDASASAGLEVSGSMMVDAFIYKQGLRMRNTLHSSVNFKGSVTVKNRQIVNVDIQAPEHKQELFDARSQFFIIHDNFEKEQEMIKENSVELKACTGDKFEEVTGLELCAEVQYPNATFKQDAPHFPITGPFSASITLDKKDTLRNYKIFAKWIKNSKKIEGQLQIDTPGSKVDRLISADVTIGFHENKHVDIYFRSPWKKLVLNGKAMNNDALASLTGNIVIDDTQQYKMTLEMMKNKKGNTYQYKPFVEIQKNQEKYTLLSGDVTYTKQRDLSVDLELRDDFWNNKSFVIESRIINHKQEKRLFLEFGVKGQKHFKIDIWTISKLSGKRVQIYKGGNNVLIKTPRGVIVSLSSEYEFMPKPLKLIWDMTLNTIRIRKPVTLKVNIKKSRNTYPVTVKFMSSVFTGDLKGKVDKRRNSYSSIMKLNYKTASMNDQIIINGKLIDRSKNTNALYTLNSGVKSKNNPELNSVSKFTINHRINQKEKGKTSTSFKSKINYGNKIVKKNNPKVIDLSWFVECDIKKVMGASIQANLEAKVPEKDIDIQVNLDHDHSKKKLESEVTLHLLPFVTKDINAAVNLQHNDKSSTANGTLQIEGNHFNLMSDLTKMSNRRFQHTLVVSSNSDEKHKIMTVYKTGYNKYDVQTDLKSTRLDQPLQLSLSAFVKNPSDIQFKGALKENKKDLYTFDAVAKLAIEKAGKWQVNIISPFRNVRAQANFNKVKSRINAEALVNWDVESKKPTGSEVRVNGAFTHISDTDLLSMKSNIKINTPFQKFEKIFYNMNFRKTAIEMESSGKLSWGGIHKRLSGELSAKLPMSIENINVVFEAKTPFKKCKELELKIDHVLKPEISELMTTLIGKMNDNQLTLKGNKKNDHSSIEGDLAIKTTSQSIKRISMNLQHASNEMEDQVTLKIDKDGSLYEASLESTNAKSQSEIQKNCQLTLVSPDHKAKGTFTYITQKGKHMITTNLNAAQIKNKKNKVTVEISGSYIDVNHLDFMANLRSPMKSFRRSQLEIIHKINENEMNCKLVIMKNRALTGYDLKLKNKDSDATADVLLLLSPFYEKDVSLSSTVGYKNYPLTISSQIIWAPQSVINLSGSFNAENDENVELNLRLTTPFTYVDNIGVIATRKLEHSVEIHHLIIDYDIRKRVDIELRSQNDEKIKLVRVKVASPCPYFERLDTGIIVNARKGIISTADFQLEISPEEKYEGVVSLKILKRNVRGSLDIKTPIDEFKHIEGRMTLDNPKSHKKSYLKLSKDNENIVYVTLETEKIKDVVSIKAITKGKILNEHYVNTLNEFGIYPRYWMNKDEYKTIEKLTTEVKFEQKDEMLKMNASFIIDFGNIQHLHSVTFRKVGDTLNDVDIDLAITNRHQTFETKLVLKLIDDIHVQATVKDPFDDVHGIDYSHSLISNSAKMNSIVYWGELGNTSCSFFMTDVQHIEFSASHQMKVYKGSQVNSVKYRHENRHNGMSCSLTFESDKAILGSIDLVAESEPIHLISLIVVTPHKDFKKIVISGEFDEVKINGLVQVDNTNISLSGFHENFKNPKLTLKTPLHLLRELSVDVDGQISDGSSKLSLLFNENDRVEGTIAVKYETPNQMLISIGLESNINVSRNSVKFDLQADETPRKTTHLLLSLNDVDKIIFDIEGDLTGENRAEMELKYPSLELESNQLIMNIDGLTETIYCKIQVLDDSHMLTDLELNVDANDKRLIVREPKHMEYRFSLDNSGQSNKNELYLNWDMNDPEAVVTINTEIKDESNSNKLDKVINMKLSCPSRTIGFEYSITATSNAPNFNVQSNGKLFWNDAMDSQVSYDLNVKDNSDRRKNVYKGDLKIQLPTRTIGFSASTIDLSTEHSAESTFSWDLARDPSKKIGIKTMVVKGIETHAEISLILPQDAHIDSKLVLHKGNTILEGQTQVFYSDDSSKTLTLFSKVEKNDGNTGLMSFVLPEKRHNYSIQFGLSHPDSRVDMKVDSHWAIDKERLTTSVGFDYLNSRKETKNWELFFEINKLKQQINLYSTTPWKQVEFSGTVVRQDPLELRATKTVDGVIEKDAHFVVLPDEKRILYEKMEDGKVLSIAALYPNEKAFQIEVNRMENHETQELIKTVFELSAPNVLQTTLNWRPGMLLEFRDSFFQNVKDETYDWKAQVDEIGNDVKEEFTRKYEDIQTSFIDDVKSVVEFSQQELTYLETDLNQIKTNLHSTFKFCDIKIGDFELNEELVKLQDKIKAYALEFNEGIKSYTGSYKIVLREILQGIESLKNLPIDESYKQFWDTIIKLEEDLIRSCFTRFARWLYHAERKHMDEFWEFLDDIIDYGLDPRPAIKDLNKRMKVWKEIKISTYVKDMIMNNEEVTSKMNAIVETLVKAPMADEIVEALGESMHGFYDKTKSAYDNLKVEEKLPLLLDDLIDYILEEIETKVHDKMGYMHRVISNPITKFDPEEGFLRAEFPLFFNLERLDEMPNTTQFEIAEDMENKVRQPIDEDLREYGVVTY